MTDLFPEYPIDRKLWAARTFGEEVDAELRKIEQEKKRQRQHRAYLRADDGRGPTYSRPSPSRHR